MPKNGLPSVAILGRLGSARRYAKERLEEPLEHTSHVC